MSPQPEKAPQSGGGSRWQTKPPSRPTSPSSPLSASTSSLQNDAAAAETGNERRKLFASTAVEKPASWAAAAQGSVRTSFFFKRNFFSFFSEFFFLSFFPSYLSVFLSVFFLSFSEFFGVFFFF